MPQSRALLHHEARQNRDREQSPAKSGAREVDPEKFVPLRFILSLKGLKVEMELLTSLSSQWPRSCSLLRYVASQPGHTSWWPCLNAAKAAHN
jgi:hypothetical protein